MQEKRPCSHAVDLSGLRLLVAFNVLCLSDCSELAVLSICQLFGMLLGCTCALDVGRRYCMNAAALEFIEVSKLPAEMKPLVQG